MNKKTKGSILAYSLIILATMLAIVSSMSMITVTKKKDASSTQSSAQAFQVADSGAQAAIGKINGHLKDYPNDSIKKAFSCSDDGGVAVSTGNFDLVSSMPYDITFYEQDTANVIKSCDEQLRNVKNIKIVGSYKNTARAIMVSVTRPSTLYITNSGSGKLNVFDLANPFSPKAIKQLDISSPPYHVAVSGNYAYVADHTNDTIDVLSIYNPNDPERIKIISSPVADPVGVVATNSYLYVTFYNQDKLGVFKIDPGSGNLNYVNSFATDDGPYGMAIVDNYLYLANSISANIQVFDITLPENPQPIPSAAINLGGVPSGVAIWKNYLYVANETKDWIDIVDIKNRNAPEKGAGLRINNVTSKPNGLATFNNVLYVVRRTGIPGIGVYDLTNDPEHPVAKSDVNATNLNAPLGIAVARF